MAQIATTTTLTTDSLVARTLGTGVSRRGMPMSTEGILQSLFPSQHSRRDGGGDDPPEPNRRDTGKRPDRGGPSGGDPDEPGGGDGGGGGRPNPQGYDGQANPRPLSDKLIGKEPEIFKGD